MIRLYKMLFSVLMVLSLFSAGYAQTVVKTHEKQETKKINQNSISPDQTKAIELFRLANEKIEFRDYEDAIVHYTEALVYYPKFKEALKNRGICYSLLKNNHQAINDFNKAIALDSNDAYLYNFRGFATAEIAFEMDDHEHFEKAISDIEKAIELMPDYAEAYLNKGIVMMWLDDYQEAIYMFDKVISFNSNNAKAYYDRGIAYDKMGNIAKACLDWDRAKRLNFPLANNMINSYCE